MNTTKLVLSVLLDLLLSARPVRIAHVIYPTLTGLSYILFTLVYWSLGGRNEHGSRGIYPPALDWDNPVISIIWTIRTIPLQNLVKNLSSEWEMFFL